MKASPSLDIAINSPGVRRCSAIGAIGATAFLAGCGNIPKAEVRYYLATTTVSVQVVRSVLCDAGNQPVVATTVVPTVTHQADAGQDKAHTLNLDWFRSWFSDADVKVELFDDGRLKSVNASTTGQGEAVLKAAMSVLSSMASSSVTATDASRASLCKKISEQNGGKPILVTYSGVLQLDSAGQATPIPAEAASRFYADLVAPLVGTVCAMVQASSAAQAGPGQVASASKDPQLMVRQPGWADFSVRSQAPGKPCIGDEPPLYSGRAVVAQLGPKAYGIPVPKPAVFGKQGIGLVFAESGALTSLQYTSATGTTQALGSLNSLLTEARGGTTAQKAAEVKANADLIEQQQRLVQCIADKCPK